MDLVLIGDLDRRVFGANAAVLPAPARWIGRRDDAELRALYAGAACFVFPSLNESFGLPAVEAMACGCPVVASTAGSLPEVCGEAALLADPRDPRAIAAAVRRVLDEPGLADRLRAAGHARAGGYTWRDAAMRLRGLAEELAAAGPRG
jgi:glycosyltransferase involved in cell wall biosynthesis